MAYQFIHIENYGLSPSKKAKVKKPTVDEVLNEAERKEGYTPHIASPKPPITLYGSINDVRKAVDQYVLGTTDAKGRKLRSDANVLLAGVVSLPRDMGNDWELYKQKSIKWLQEKYGDRLKAIVEHTDESHPHLHFYAVEPPGKPFDLHPGITAFRKTQGKGKKLAMIQAMRDFQDDFWRNVSAPFGLPKLGPRKQRLTRAEWKAQQDQLKKIRQINKIVEKRVEERLQRKIEEMESGLIGKVKLGLMALHSPTKAAIDQIKEFYENMIKDLKELLAKKDKEIAGKEKEIEKLREDLRQTNNFHNAALTRATNAEKQVEKLNKIIEQQDEEIDRLNNTLKKHGIRVMEPQSTPQSSYDRKKSIEL